MRKPIFPAEMESHAEQFARSSVACMLATLALLVCSSLTVGFVFLCTAASSLLPMSRTPPAPSTDVDMAASVAAVRGGCEQVRQALLADEFPPAALCVAFGIAGAHEQAIYGCYQTAVRCGGVTVGDLYEALVGRQLTALIFGNASVRATLYFAQLQLLVPPVNLDT